MRPGTIFREVSGVLLKEIDKIANYLSNPQDFFINFKSRLDEFEKEYEQYFADRSRSTTLKLINASEKLNVFLSAFHRLSSVIISSLEQSEEIVFTNNERSLTILVGSDSQFSTFISKATALKVIYEEMCRIFEVLTSEFPLKISHLEFGSFWVKLFGESKIIALMTKFLEETAGYFYRNKTKEGRRKETSSKAIELKQLLDLENELKEKGFDTTEMRESLQKASQVISQEYFKSS